MTKNVLLLEASIKELNAKVDSLSKTIEMNKKTKKELQVRNRTLCKTIPSSPESKLAEAID